MECARVIDARQILFLERSTRILCSSSERLRTLCRGEGHAVGKDSFWHDPESREKGTTNPTCFSLITEIRLTHFQRKRHLWVSQLLSSFLTNTQHSLGREKDGEEAAPSCALELSEAKRNSVMVQKTVRGQKNKHCREVQPLDDTRAVK